MWGWIALSTTLAGPAWSNEFVETDHLRIQWVEGVAPEAVEAAQDQGEAYFAAIAERLGYAPEHKIHVLLNGHANQPDGSWEYPRVDGWGRVHLWRYTDEATNYFNAFAHELVHAFRYGRRASADWFFEEAFAEFVALELDPSVEGFPWYGSDVDVVAGHWLSSGHAIPLAEMRARHREINMKCRAQTYSLRASFFLYLAATHGADQVYAMAAQEPSGTDAQYQELFGAPLEKLEEDWTTWALDRFEAVPNYQIKAVEYLRSPVQYMNICDPETDL